MNYDIYDIESAIVLGAVVANNIWEEEGRCRKLSDDEMALTLALFKKRANKVRKECGVPPRNNIKILNQK